jgi:hypothetical protein
MQVGYSASCITGSMPCIASNQWVKVPSGKLFVHPGSFGDTIVVRRNVKFPEKPCRRVAKSQAATKVNLNGASTMRNEDADPFVSWGRLKGPSVTETDKLVWIVFRGGKGGMARRFDEVARDILMGTQAMAIRKRKAIVSVRGSEASIVPLRFQRQHNFGTREGALPCTSFLRRNGRAIAYA